MNESQLFTAADMSLQRFRNLYHDDNKLFNEITEFIPFSLTISQVQGGGFKLINPHLVDILGVSKEDVLNLGFSFTKSLIHPMNLDYQISVLANFKFEIHQHQVLKYFQFLKGPEHRDFSWMMTHKLFLSEDLYLSSYQNLDDFYSVFPTLRDYLGDIALQICEYQKLQLLTKQERWIAKMIVEGMTNKEIAEMNFLSPHTVRTHRNRIWKKLDIKKVRDLLKYQAFL